MGDNFVSFKSVIEDLEKNPKKRIFWRSGFAWKGAGESEISRDHKDYPKTKSVNVNMRIQWRTINSWKDDLKAKFDWACVVEMDSNTDEEMHLNGLSENDMY